MIPASLVIALARVRAEKSPDNWLTREFFRANERIESLPPHARPIQVRPTPTIETKETQ